MRLLFYTDLHAKDQNPRSRTGSYREDILTKLTEIVSLAKKYEVDYLINGADTFDQKSSWRTSHLLVQQMIEILQGFPGDRHITIIGTHDVPTGQLEKVPQQPLGVLARAGVITVLPIHPKVTFRDDIGFHAVHASYDLDKKPSNYELHWEGPDKPGVPVVTIAHGMVVPPGGSFFGDYTRADDIDTEVDLFMYGHPHTPDGIYDNGRGTMFVGPGSVARLGSYPYNRTRVPDVVLIEHAPDHPAGWLFKLIPLESARPPEDVFADVIQDEEDENATQERVQQFVETLKSANISDDSWGLDELIAEIQSADVPQRVRQVAEEILSQVA